MTSAPPEGRGAGKGHSSWGEGRKRGDTCDTVQRDGGGGNGLSYGQRGQRDTVIQGGRQAQGPGELGRLWGCLGDHVCTGLRGASGGKGGKGLSGPLSEGHGPGGPRELTHLKRKWGGQAPSQRGGRGLCQGLGGRMGLRGGEPLTLQVVPSNKLEDFVEPDDW